MPKPHSAQPVVALYLIYSLIVYHDACIQFLYCFLFYSCCCWYCCCLMFIRPNHLFAFTFYDSFRSIFTYSSARAFWLLFNPFVDCLKRIWVHSFRLTVQKLSSWSHTYLLDDLIHLCLGSDWVDSVISSLLRWAHLRWLNLWPPSWTWLLEYASFVWKDTEKRQEGSFHVRN